VSLDSAARAPSIDIKFGFDELVLVGDYGKTLSGAVEFRKLYYESGID